MSTATPDRPRSSPQPTPPDSSIRVIAVVGPTAVGKTFLAEEIAIVLGGEIVTADSMQLYRGMDIGTAKSMPQGRRVPHHCLDLADPGENFSAALYQRHARNAITAVHARGGVPVLAGGTGLYVRAALDDLRFPPGDTRRAERQRIERLAARLSAQDLHDRLRAIDPAAAALIHPNNVRRVVRALEMATGGFSYADQATRFAHRESVYDARFIGLTRPREGLYRAIDDRVDAMIRAGLLGEVRQLLDAGFREALTAAQAIGYKELVPVLEQAAALDDAVAAIKQATRRFAKRQLTWFKADARVRWIDVEGMSGSQVAQRALALLESGEPAPYPQHDHT